MEETQPEKEILDIKQELLLKTPEKKEVPVIKKDEKEGSDFFWKAIIGIILVALLLVGVLLPIKLVPSAMSRLSQGLNGYFKSKDPVSLNKKSVGSGDTFTLGLNSTTTDPASATYTLNYPCRDGVYLEYSKTGKDSDLETISCETPFTFSANTQTITLRAMSKVTATVEQPITIDIVTASTFPFRLGEVTLTISNTNILASSTNSNNLDATGTTSVTGTTSTSTSYATSSNAQPKSKALPYTGPADLSVRLGKIGVAGGNGQIINTTSFRASDTIILQFIIENLGGKTVSGWTFDAYLPTVDKQSSTLHSSPQASVGHLSGSYNTITITNLLTGNQKISIELDPENKTQDGNRANNRLDVSITVVQ